MFTQLMPYGLLTILFKHQKAVAGIFLAVMLGAGGYLLFATPKYESVAQLVVRFGDRSIPEVNRTAPVELTPSDRREIVLANADILSSHDLAEQTIAAFGLDKVYPDIVADPPSRWTPMDEAVKTFQKSLSVDVGTQDNVITISLLHPDQQLVPQLVHKLIDLYVAHQSAVYQNPQSGFLAQQVKDAGGRLDKAQGALEAFKGQWHITDYDQEVADLLKQRGDVDINLRQAQANLAQAVQRQQDLQKQLQQVPKNAPAPANGEKYRALDDAQTRLGDLQSKLKQMEATYEPNSPALTTLQAGVKQAEGDVAARRKDMQTRSQTDVNPVYQTLQTDYLHTSADATSFAEPVRVLTGQLAAIDSRLTDLQQNRGTFNDLTREQQIAENDYKALSNQLQDARVKDNLNQQRISPASVISQPTLPYRTARPRKLIIVLASFVGGIILAVGGALALEAIDDRFTTAEQVTYMLELPVLASFGLRQPRMVRALLSHGDAS